MQHVLLCTERLLFRFGADRVLCLIGEHLHAAGHRVTVMVNRHDEASVAGWADRVITVAPAADYVRGNEHTADWLSQHWQESFAAGSPDVAIVGGWPFFAAIPLLRAHGVPTIYFDCGAVPTDGMSGGALAVQLELQRQRRRHLPSATVIAPISEFLARSQSAPDSGGDVPIRTIRLGADHLERGLWQRTGGVRSTLRRDAVDRAFASGGPVLLHLGRWEPDNYKNGRALWPLVASLAARHPNLRALVLADVAEVQVPPALAERIIAIGAPDDAELEALMRRVDLGVVLSRWEGFGLPLAEMQWLGRPVLAFAGHAHDEVALDPRYLCESEAELARKALEILDGGELALVPPAATARFRADFRWQRTLEAWQQLVEEVAAGQSQQPINLLIDATFACIDPANSGVIRVTRQMSRALQGSVNVWFVRWDHRLEGYVFPNAREYAQLGEFNGPRRAPTAIVSPPNARVPLTEHLQDLAAGRTWLCITETVAADVLARARRAAHAQGLRVAAIFYDAIPVLHPELVPDVMIRDNHADYMRELAGCDVVLPISRYSGQCLERFWNEQGVPATAVAPVLLAGSIGPAAVAPIHSSADRTVELLFVSTLEPRKNHERLLAACVALKQRRPDLRWRLRLVGNSYAGAEDLAARIVATCREHPEIDYLGIVDDAELTRLYRQADFTVYPSVVEGFGLPIVESLAFGKPCLCADTGVMAELAADGGCLTVDVTDVSALSAALESLITDRALRATLAQQACRRRVRTWEAYASDFTATLAKHWRGTAAATRPDTLMRNGKFTLEDALFPGCLHDGWQMNLSERIGLRGVLAHLQPRCAVEIGTYKGGSLSLIAQYARVVFSIDIEPMPPGVRVFPNVSFLTGPSDVVLPALLDELEAQDLAPDFVLVDADHSREGVRRDLNLLIHRRVSRPLWIMMHDSINPGCRAGMLDVDWNASPWVHYVELDFITGRVIEHGGLATGELWGGLGLACMLPEPRQGTLQPGQSAIDMVRRLLESTHAAMPS